MNKKYKKYIDYIVKDIKPPYFKCMRDHYGLKQDECVLVLSKVFNQPVSIKGRDVYDTNNKLIYREDSNGYWVKWEYDTNGNVIYREYSNGYWVKQVYNQNNDRTYYENSDGYIEDNR